MAPTVKTHATQGGAPKAVAPTVKTQPPGRVAPTLNTHATQGGGAQGGGAHRQDAAPKAVAPTLKAQVTQGGWRPPSRRMPPKAGAGDCPGRLPGGTPHSYPFLPHAEINGAVARSIEPLATFARCWSISSLVARPAVTSRSRICATVAVSSAVQAGDASGK